MKNYSSVKKEAAVKIILTVIFLFSVLLYQPESNIVKTGLLLLLFLIFCTILIVLNLRFFKKIELIFREKELLFEKISSMSSHGILLTSSTGIIEDLNIKAQSYFYESENSVIGKSIYRNLDCSPNNCKSLKTIFYNDLGSHFHAEIQIKSIKYDNKKHFVFYIDDQTERINNEKMLKKLASEDSLTGLLNRRSFMAEFKKEVERSGRIGLTSSIAMIDLDHFKSINDTYGHDFGDEVLKVFAQILRDNSRQLDILCRYGGEEFMLLLPHTNLENTLQFLYRIKNEFADYCFSYNIQPTFSGGAINTEMEKEKVDVDQLLKEVDRLLYKAKNSGRNRIVTKDINLKLIKVS